jgi:flavin-dependent dehydrogenase
VLLVEAVPDGWWYAPPTPPLQGSLVFVTDVECLPRAPEARRALLEAAHARATLIAEYGEAAASAVPRGLDAHAGEVREPVVGRLAAIGDAALSLDPLSGSGIQLAIEGARTAAADVLGNGAVGPDYLEWFNALRSRQHLEQRQSYAAAARRFPGSQFWQARVRSGERRETERAA